MSDYNLLPLAFLYTNNRKEISGAMRFQKLVFLAQEEQDDVPNIYPYRADRFGPFSPDLAGDLDTLIEYGLIERNVVMNSAGNERYDYRITKSGIQKVQSLLQNDKLRPVLDAISRTKAAHNDEPIGRLLRYVYRKYDDYATESELDIDRLMDPNAESQFLEPEDDDERDFAGPPPGKWKQINPSAEDFFSVE